MSIPNISRKSTRPASILKVSRYGPSSSPSEAAPETRNFQSPLANAKTINFDLSHKNITSIENLDLCSTAANNLEDNQPSSASTEAGSKVTLDLRSFSRSQSLMTELEVCDEEESVQETPKCLFMRSKSVEISHDFSIRPPQSSPDQSPTGLKLEYQQISPVFDSEGAFAESYAFSRDRKTVTHITDGRFSAISADKPLPSSGKVKFSVSIGACKKDNPRLYVGVVSRDQKDKQLSYKAGWNFVSTFSNESYLNGLKLLKQDSFAKRGQIVSVLVDMDEKLIAFELEGVVILKGKLIVQKGKTSEFYPCISLGEVDGTVSFV